MVAPGYEINELIAGASQLATSALAAALWQGALLAGAAALGLRLLPETPAPVRFAIWFAVFLLVAGLPFATISAGHNAASATGVVGSHPWLTLDARWCLWIAAIWAVASMVRAATLIAAAFRVRALWKRAQPIELSVPGAIARKAQVCVSSEVDRPTVIGFFAPKIVIPDWLIAKLSPAELEQVVLHEASHLSRRDDWLNLLQKLALVIFPMNPALAWIERRLCFERELACDERVLRTTGAPRAYAECLATLAEYRLERRGLVRDLALALGALGRESELAQRVIRILSGGGRMKRRHARLVFGGSMLLLVFAAGALERSPQLVAFSHPGATTSKAHLGTVEHSDVRAVAVRASVTPAEQWKTMGDAAPHIAKRAPARKAEAQREQSAEQRSPVAATDVVASVSPAPTSVTPTARVRSMNAPQMIQTVATTRQVAQDGDVVVTRWVTVTAYGPDSRRSVSDAPQQEITEHQVPSYAAVPVQGGWLVFQL